MTTPFSYKSSQNKQRSQNIQKQKIPRHDHISMIQQNLKIMKNQADQFLKKGNKQLPPITKARHYLYLSYLKQNLNFLQLTADDKKNILKETESNSLKKYKTLSPKRIQLKDQNNGSLIKFISKNQKTLLFKKNQIYNWQQTKILSQSQDAAKMKKNDPKNKNIKSPKLINVQYHLKGSQGKIRNNKPVKNDYIQNLKRTQYLSGSIIKELHAKHQFLIKTQRHHYQYLNQRNELKDTIKSIEDVPINQVFIFKDSNNFNPQNQDNNLNQSQKQLIHKQINNKVENIQFLSSDSIDLKSQSIQQCQKNEFTMVKQCQFNPLRSQILKKQSGQSLNSLKNELFFSNQIVPKKLQHLPDYLKHKWLKQLESNHQQSRYQSKYFNENQIEQQSAKKNKTYYHWRRKAPLANKLKHKIFISTDEGKQKRENCEPWKNDQNDFEIQQFNFNEILEI